MTEKLSEQTIRELREEHGAKEGDTLDFMMGGFRWVIEPDGTLHCCLPRQQTKEQVQ